MAGAAAATTAELASTFVAVTARGAKDSQIFYFPMRSGKQFSFYFQAFSNAHRERARVGHLKVIYICRYI